MTTYAADYDRRAVPGDESSEGGFIIRRNRRIYARRQTLGAARAVVSNVIRIAGDVDTWTITDDDGDRYPLK